MKAGDLIEGAKGSEYEGFCGFVWGFDEDNDPIIKWAGCDGSWEMARCGDYRSSVRVINESR